MQWLDGLSSQMSWVIKGVFELNLLLLFVICLVHSLKVHRWQRTCREFSLEVRGHLSSVRYSREDGVCHDVKVY